MKYSLKKCSTTYSSELEIIYWLHLKICLVIFPWKTTKQNHVFQAVIILTKQLHITLKAKVNSLCFVSKLLVPPRLILIFVFTNLEAGYAGKQSFVRKQISTQLLPFLFFQLEYLVTNPFFLPKCSFKFVNKTQKHVLKVVIFLTKQLHITLKTKVN